MTRAADAGELVKLRSNGQWARWKVIIDSPDVIYTARSTGVINRTNYAITFDGGSGTLTNCLQDMTILIGSTAGGSEHGIGRLRRTSQGGDTAFYVGADPALLVQDDDYLTIVNDFAPMSKHPADTYIDFDVSYSDQFTNFIPVPIFSERVVVIAAGGTASFDCGESWVPGSTITGIAWTFTGATSSTGPTTATPTATYNTSGRYRVKLVLTAANGKTGTGWGWVYVLGDNLIPDTGCKPSEPEGETEIGWAYQVVAYDRPTIKDRARVILISDDFYNNIMGSIGPVSGVENQVVVGWIIGETIIRDPGYDYVEFAVGGPGVLAGNIATLPAGLIDTAWPTDTGTTVTAWGKMASLTHIKGLHYLINYRSTLATVIDVEVEDWNWPAHKLTTDDETLWGQLQTFARHGMMQCTPNRYGHLYVQRDAALYSVGNRTADIPVIIALGDSDWADELTIVRRQMGEASMVEVEGTVFNAGNGTVTPAGGRSPGELPGSHGTIVNVSEINWPDWTTSLELAGLMMGQLCTEYEQIGVYHPANNHFIDVAPRQYVNVTVDGSTLRTIPRRITMNRDDEGQITVELELEPEGGQYDAANILYPDEGAPPPEPPEIPPEPPPPPIEPPVEPPEVSGTFAVVVTADDVRVTENLNAGSPTWVSVISGGPTAPIDSDLNEIQPDVICVIEANGDVWMTEDLTTGGGGTVTWTKMWDSSQLGTGGAGVAIEFEALLRVRFAPGSATHVYVLGCGQVDGDMKPFVLHSSNGGQTWHESWIDDVLPEATPYTMDVYPFDVSISGGNYYWNTTVAQRASGAGHPMAVGLLCTATSNPPNGVGFSEDGGSINGSGSISNVPASPPAFQGESSAALTAALDDYFGAGNYSHQLFTIHYGNTYVRLIAQGTSGSRAGNIYVLWDIPNLSEPTALDVARTNNAYVYVGTAGKVWKSIDGAITWEESLDDHGSNDIAVDPQLAGVYYHWAADGSLELVNSDVVIPPDLNNETPVQVGVRLARDLNSGRLFGLESGIKLWTRNLGVETDLDTGLTGARGLHVYLGGKLVYLDAADIYYSEDYGVIYQAKKGGWAAYANPINAHLLRET